MEFSDAAVAAILAAIVGGAFSLLGLVLTKEQKISDLRQAWIDSLREDVSKLIAASSEVAYAPIPKEMPDPALEARMVAVVEDANIRTYRIKLRLNLKEPEAQRMDAALDRLQDLAQTDPHPDVADMEDAEADLVRATQIVLKKEWERVKSGELNYRIAKYTASTLLFVAVGLFIASLFLRKADDDDRSKNAALTCVANQQVEAIIENVDARAVSRRPAQIKQSSTKVDPVVKCPAAAPSASQ